MAWRSFLLHPAVVGNHGFIAEHDAVGNHRVPADVTLAAEDRSADDRLLADAAVGPDDRMVHRRVLFDMALPADHRVRPDAGAGLDDRAFIDEARPFEGG